MSIVKIGLGGSSGKTGSVIKDLIADNKGRDFELVAELNSRSLETDFTKAGEISDVIIDFSTPKGFNSLASIMKNAKAKLVVGTTGLTAENMKFLGELGKVKPVLYASNTAIGPNLIAELAAKTAAKLRNYDVEIIEMHHKHKIDAPSGTALMLAKEIAKAKNIDFKENIVFSRKDQGKREEGDIGISSVRGGGIYGEHEIIFAGENEVISINCRALSRKSYAEGALLAASWLNKQPPGLYSMKDIFEF